MPKTTKNKDKKGWNTLSIIAIATIWFPFAGPILGIIALFEIKKTGEKGKGLAIAAIVLPVIATALLAAVVYILISSSIENTREKADQLGITTNEYSQLQNAINGSCQLQLLERGQFNDFTYSGVEESSIVKVTDGYALGYRECTGKKISEVFIAKKDLPQYNDSSWRVIYSGAGLPCSLFNSGVPEGLLQDCVKDRGSPVRAL